MLPDPSLRRSRYMCRYKLRHELCRQVSIDSTLAFDPNSSRFTGKLDCYCFADWLIGTGDNTDEAVQLPV